MPKLGLRRAACEWFWLVGLDVLSKNDTGHYALTEESAMFLVTGKPSYHGAFFLLTKEPMLSAWGQLEEAVRIGLAD